MLVLTRAHVELLLDPDAPIDAVGVAMSELTAGRARSVGVAVQDAAAVSLVLDAARREGVGRAVEL